MLFSTPLLSFHQRHALVSKRGRFACKQFSIKDGGLDIYILTDVYKLFIFF